MAKKMSKPSDELITEVAHVIWYRERGSTIDDSEELGQAWAEEHAEVRGYVIQLLDDLRQRGIGVTYDDLKKSMFGKT